MCLPLALCVFTSGMEGFRNKSSFLSAISYTFMDYCFWFNSIEIMLKNACSTKLSKYLVFILGFNFLCSKYWAYYCTNYVKKSIFDRQKFLSSFVTKMCNHESWIIFSRIFKLVKGFITFMMMNDEKGWGGGGFHFWNFWKLNHTALII